MRFEALEFKPLPHRAGQCTYAVVFFRNGRGVQVMDHTAEGGGLSAVRLIGREAESQIDAEDNGGRSVRFSTKAEVSSYLLDTEEMAEPGFDWDEYDDDDA